MDALTARIYNTVTSAHAGAALDTETALSVFLRTLNSLLLSAAATPYTHSHTDPHTPNATDPTAPMMPTTADVDRLLRAFIWTTGCCKETTYISDTYNTTHLCGIVLCKYLFLSTRTLPPALLTDLFADSKGMHISEKPIQTMQYDTIVQVIAALQHEWPRICDNEPRNGIAAVVACMARFGQFLLFHQNKSTLDDIQNREPISENAVLFRPTKRCTRAITTTCLCMLRSVVMLACALHTRICHVDAPHTRTLVYAALFENDHTAHARLSPAMRASAARVRYIRTAITGNIDNTDIDDPEVLWAFLVKRLGSPRIGVLPRRRDAALIAFLQDAVLFVSQQNRSPTDIVICGSTMRVVETALRYFYVVPSADIFRHLDLLETISSGHRLNYSLDYAQFDTGVLSQVVYLHNPLHKAGPPPTCVGDWKKGNCAGPIAAFCQLLPELQVWYEDCQDPLGVRNEDTHITKPSDNCIEETVRDSESTRWVLIVSRARVLLVDRSCADIHMVTPAETATKEHHALGTLMLYIYKTNQIHTIATVAINGYKINNTKAAESEI